LIEPHLRLQTGQQVFTPAQEEAARRFADTCIQAQLSTEPVKEQEAEALLKQAYQGVGLPSPKRIRWVQSPLQLVVALSSQNVGAGVWEHVWERIWTSFEERVLASVEGSIWEQVWELVWERVWERVEASVGVVVQECVWEHVEAHVEDHVEVRAYYESPWMALGRFFDVYLAPNETRPLAHFNDLVSGYWLGKEEAFIIHRPRLLSRDGDGRLHSARGKCLEYRDGWGFYAWHGVRVPEKVILAPERLTSVDWSEARDMEVRRVILERMGERF
jgi:hypothetical protein